MPVCGFDKNMLDGLEKFLTGLIDAIERNSKLNNTSKEKTIEEEIKEMEEFVKELQVLRNKLNKEKLIGLVYFARAFYLSSLQRAKEENIDVNEAMKKEIKDTINFFDEVDKIYYERLKGKVSQPLKELVKWIEKQK